MLKIFKKNNNKGFTLVELIITMAVFAIVMLQVSTIMYNCSRLYVKGVDNVDLQGEAQRVIQFTEELLIDVPSDGEVNTEADPLIPDSEVITIKTAKFDKLTNTSVPVEYKLFVLMNAGKEYGTLKLSKDGGVAEDVADYVKAISIDKTNYESDDRITISLSMQSEDYTYDSVAIKDVYLRNHPGSHKTDDDGDTTQGKYMVEVLRFHDYNVAAMTGLGSGYTYTLDPNSGNPEDYYVASDGTNVHCQSETNKSFGKKTAAKIIVTDAEGAEISTIALDTKKVKVGLGSEGSNTGAVVCYGDVSTQQLKVSSYADVVGISLDDNDIESVSAQFTKNGSDVGGSFGTGSDRNFNTGDNFRLDHFKYDFDGATNAYILTSQGFFMDDKSTYREYIKGGKDLMKCTITVNYEYNMKVIFNVYFAPLGVEAAALDASFWNSL